MALMFYSCKGGCGDHQGFSPGNLPDAGSWTCAKCVALRQARATTYARAKQMKYYKQYGGGSQIVTNPCPTCGTQMDTAICMFCSQQAIGKALRHTMRGTVTKDKAGRITGAQVAKWFREMPQPNTDMIMPISGTSPLGIILDEMKASYSSCQDHKGEYGTNCEQCAIDLAAYRRSKE